MKTSMPSLETLNASATAAGFAKLLEGVGKRLLRHGVVGLREHELV